MASGISRNAANKAIKITQSHRASYDQAFEWHIIVLSKMMIERALQVMDGEEVQEL